MTVLGAGASTASTLSSLLGDAAGERRRGGSGSPRTWASSTARRGPVELDFISLGARAGARHRRPAAHPDALLHRADGQGGPPLGGLGDLADRHLLPVHAGARATAPPRWSGRRRSLAAPGAANSAAPLLAFELGGTILLGIIAAVAFATILAVVAGLTITAAASFAHDIYANVHQARRGRRAKPRSGSRASPRSSSASVAILGGIFANGQNIAFLVALAFAVAASANLPTILYSLFWKRFNTRGALWSIYGGSDLARDADHLLARSCRASRRPGDRSEPVDAHDPSIDFHWFPLDNPGIVSIPLAFFLGWLGTVTSARTDPREVRRDGGPLPDRRRRREGWSSTTDAGRWRVQPPAGNDHGAA